MAILVLLPVSARLLFSPAAASGKKQAAKSKEEIAQEKKKELEKRLQDVSGQLSNNKKPAKKGELFLASSGDEGPGAEGKAASLAACQIG